MSLLNASKFRTKINCDTSMTQGEVRVENTEIILTLFCAETYFCKAGKIKAREGFMI